MKVSDLMQLLSHIHPNAEVGVIVDGAVRCYPEFGWTAKSGMFVLSDAEAPVYYEEDQPAMLPQENNYRLDFWFTPEYKDGTSRIL